MGLKLLALSLSLSLPPSLPLSLSPSSVFPNNRNLKSPLERHCLTTIPTRCLWFATVHYIWHKFLSYFLLHTNGFTTIHYLSPTGLYLSTIPHNSQNTHVQVHACTCTCKVRIWDTTISSSSAFQIEKPMIFFSTISNQCPKLATSPYHPTVYK